MWTPGAQDLSCLQGGRSRSSQIGGDRERDTHKGEVRGCATRRRSQGGVICSNTDLPPARVQDSHTQPEEEEEPALDASQIETEICFVSSSCLVMAAMSAALSNAHVSLPKTAPGAAAAPSFLAHSQAGCTV